MDLESALKVFSDNPRELPVEAMAWSLANWEQAGPRLLALLEGYAAGRDRSPETERAVFFAAHLAAGAGDHRAFAPLCRLGHDLEAAELALGDALTATFNGMLISTFDGDAEPLKHLIESPSADELTAAAALEALAYLTASGRLPGSQTEAYLRDLPGRLPDVGADFLWSAWGQMIAVLGLHALVPLVREAFDSGRIDRSLLRVEDFERALERSRSEPDRLDLLAENHIKPLDDPIGELSSWSSAEDDEEDDDWADIEEEPDWSALAEGIGIGGATLPHRNPYKDIGRNDPCPCGSGRKYKKCCLR